MKKIITFIMLLICVISLNAQVLDSSLIAYYPFNGNTKDESLYKNNGVNHNAILTEDRFGNKNRAYSFNGTSSFIDIGICESLNSDKISVITYCGWFNAKSDACGLILRHGTTGVGGGVGQEIGFEKSNLTIRNWNKNSSNYFTDKYNLNKNEWHFFAVIYNFANNSIYLYVDEILVEIYTHTLFKSQYPTLNIGRNTNGEAYFDGIIDDIRIYNRILTKEEVNNLYNENLKTSITSLKTNIKIYPNPTVNFLKIEGVDIKNIEIFNSLGNKVLNTTVDNIDVSSLSNDIYFIKIYDNDNKITINKFIKK